MFKKNRKACLPVEWKNTYLTRQVNRSALDKLLSLNYRKQRYTPSSWKPIENNDCKYISRSYTPLTLQLRLMCNRPGYSEVKRLEKGRSLVGLSNTRNHRYHCIELTYHTCAYVSCPVNRIFFFTSHIDFLFIFGQCGDNCK